MNMNNRNMGENPSCGMQPVQNTQPMPERMYAGNMRRGQPMMGSRAAYQTRCGLMRQINEASFAMDDAQLLPIRIMRQPCSISGTPRPCGETPWTRTSASSVR